MRKSSAAALFRNAATVGLLLALIPGTSSGQEGYSLEPGRAVIDSKDQWERWKAPSGTVQIGDEGVTPAFIRKSTTLAVGGKEVTVPGINAILDAGDFGGGFMAAGSNGINAVNVTDGDLTTYWEPDNSHPVRDWWVKFDLGRSVSATKIVLKFVDDELGDPFLHFKVTTSQGEVTVGPPLTRTRFTTKKPVNF